MARRAGFRDVGQNPVRSQNRWHSRVELDVSRRSECTSLGNRNDFSSRDLSLGMTNQWADIYTFSLGCIGKNKATVNSRAPQWTRFVLYTLMYSASFRINLHT